MATELAAEHVPILLAIAPLRSFAQAEYLANEVPGVTIPERVLRVMAEAGTDAEDAGLELAADLAAQARSLAQRSLIRGVVLRHDGDTTALERLLRAL
jgi:methionine synthase / methylenetetrahydrofolate reductase(NADPH)